MKQSILRLFAAGLLLAPAVFSAAAADPGALVRYDFRDSVKGNALPDSAGKGAPALRLAADAKVKDGAVEYSLPLFQSKDSQKAVAEMDPAAWGKFKQGKDLREFSVAFWIRFDKRAPADFGMFRCEISKDGLLKLVFPAEPTELLTTELPVTSKVEAETGKWYHIEFAYSANSRRYMLYIDGKFQYHSDQLLLPKLELGALKIMPFSGAVKDFRFYDAALPSEELALTDADSKAFDALAAKADAVAKSAKNASLKKWASSLKALAGKYKAESGITTIAQVRRLERDLNNASALAQGIADPAKTIGDKNFTAYVTPATSQALYLPYDLPENGELTNKLELFLAQDEFETASVIVVPFEKIKSFTIQMTDLTDGKNKLPASDMDIKLVKRLYRSGGAWLSYHMDSQMRALTPDLLVNDDKTVRVDEFRRTNELLMHYPTGDEYANVSNFDFDNDWLYRSVEEFFYDAPTLQSVELREAGRNQQYLIRFHAKKDTVPGFYTGKLNFLEDGKVVTSMDVTLRVLPFILPQPRSYADVNKPYFSHMNRFEETRKGDIANAMLYNYHHVTNIAMNAEMLQYAKELGYQMDNIFIRDIAPRGKDFKFEFGGPDEFITAELDKQMDAMALRPYIKLQKAIEKALGRKDFTVWYCYSSEAGRYDRICREPDRISSLLHENGHFKLFSHGMTDSVQYYSPGTYEMNSSTVLDRSYADIWESFGGFNINYAFPFPGPENPSIMRRSVGLEAYKKHMNGHMMHGYITTQFNEFAKWPGGDGNYRTFALSYRQKNGVINRLCIVGCREGYDDIRYATMLRTQALKYAKHKDALIAREAKRQLVWLERFDGMFDDVDDFRTGAAYRILALQDLVSKREGKK